MKESAGRPLKVALFGGAFDPVHLGHLAVAHKAVKKLDLDFIYFVPAGLPPHKRTRNLTDFSHRFAMLALATAGEERFVPSLLEAGQGQPNYSIDTVRRMKSALKKQDRLYFLIGVDAFMEISVWRQPVELLTSCDFIVASRPGYTLADLGRALPEALRPSGAELRAMREQKAGGTIELPSTTIHLLDNVNKDISSTGIRTAGHKSVRQLSRYVPTLVAEYIQKEQLYTVDSPVREISGASPGKVLSFQRARGRSQRGG